MFEHLSEYERAEELADVLVSLCTPDDQFASREDAVALAGELLFKAEHGDPMAAHVVRATLQYAQERVSE